MTRQPPQQGEPPAKVCRSSSGGSDDLPGLPRLFAHFLPKFDNQQQERLLSDGSLAGARCLAISKKHSGHLVMAPPFYSKNGCANLYSRLGEVVLRAHFEAVWPDDADAFERWWEHANTHRLCYSFECVAPRIAGDHGATPNAAYMVLTCVAQPGGAGILSPTQLLSLGTSWRLPLNEVTYVSWDLAAELEAQLHRARWTLDDAGADALLASRGIQQRFLRHADTQGNTLEGFVLFALDEPLEALEPFIAAYETSVAPHRDAALEAAMRLGESCLCRAGWLLECLAQPSKREPRRAALSQEQAWQRACAPAPAAATAAAALSRTFRTLRAAYTHRVMLKQYVYCGKLQLQIDVHDDQIFFGWPLHVSHSGCVPLYRGMVVQFEGGTDGGVSENETGGGASDRDGASKGDQRNRAGGATSGAGAYDGRDWQPPPLTSADDAPIPPVRILGIAKLKCLGYLMRTFGVRNLLPTLLAEGTLAYMQRTAAFLSAWQVPEAHRPALEQTFSEWARHVEQLSALERKQLQGGSYLHLLEPFLRGERPEEGERNPLSAYALLVLDLSGGELTPQLLAGKSHAHLPHLSHTTFFLMYHRIPHPNFYEQSTPRGCSTRRRAPPARSNAAPCECSWRHRRRGWCAAARRCCYSYSHPHRTPSSAGTRCGTRASRSNGAFRSSKGATLCIRSPRTGVASCTRCPHRFHLGSPSYTAAVAQRHRLTRHRH